MGIALPNGLVPVLSLAGMLAAAWLYRRSTGGVARPAASTGIFIRVSPRVSIGLFWANVAVLLLSLSFALYSSLSRTAASRVGVQIDALGPSVATVETLRGRSTGIPAGYTIWVVVRSHSSNRLYPQEPVQRETSGVWRTTVVFGNEVDTGKLFDVLVVLADPLANNTLAEYLARGRNNRFAPGMAALPETARVLSAITVRRH